MVGFGPHVNYVAAEVPPPGGGLYTAASVVEQPLPSRLSGGVNVIGSNSGSHGVHLVECEPGEVLFEGDGPGVGVKFPAVEVWAADDCGVGRSDDEAVSRVAHILALTERVDVERHVAGLLVGRVDELQQSVGGSLADRVRDAVGRVEGLLGGLALPGVLHVPARLAVEFKHAGVVTWRGAQAYTPLGHRIAFGGGYDALGDAVYVTGPVVVLRSPTATRVGRDHRRNDRLTVASREVAVGWEHLTDGISLGAGDEG